MSDREKAMELTGRFVSNAMKFSGISQSELSRRSGIVRPYMSRLVNGKACATMETLVRVLEACGLEVLELRVKKRVPNVVVN